LATINKNITIYIRLYDYSCGGGGLFVSGFCPREASVLVAFVQGAFAPVPNKFGNNKIHNIVKSIFAMVIFSIPAAFALRKVISSIPAAFALKNSRNSKHKNDILLHEYESGL
jgi:hypothetical protein